MDRINLITSAIYSTFAYDEQKRDMRITLPEDVTADEFEQLKDVLILNRQQEAYVRTMLENLAIVRHEVDSFVEQFRKILEELHETVQYKTAIPTEQVFVGLTINRSGDRLIKFFLSL